MSPDELIVKLKNATKLAKRYTGLRGLFCRIFRRQEANSAKKAVWLNIMEGDEVSSLFLWTYFDPDKINELTDVRRELFRMYRKMWGKQ